MTRLFAMSPPNCCSRPAAQCCLRPQATQQCKLGCVRDLMCCRFVTDYFVSGLILETQWHHPTAAESLWCAWDVNQIDVFTLNSSKAQLGPEIISSADTWETRENSHAFTETISTLIVPPLKSTWETQHAVQEWACCTDGKTGFTGDTFL